MSSEVITDTADVVSSRLSGLEAPVSTTRFSGASLSCAASVKLKAADSARIKIYFFFIVFFD